jgi:hypothetical protein
LLKISNIFRVLKVLAIKLTINAAEEPRPVFFDGSKGTDSFSSNPRF